MAQKKAKSEYDREGAKRQADVERMREAFSDESLLETPKCSEEGCGRKSSYQVLWSAGASERHLWPMSSPWSIEGRISCVCGPHRPKVSDLHVEGIVKLESRVSFRWQPKVLDDLSMGRGVDDALASKMKALFPEVAVEIEKLTAEGASRV
ncbi:MAG TPA: hypothetical protein VFI25_08155 [Planctomycetota bacterium]|jgi:hypothetical protein|nr:hypothetical protein [Planctomycetota bacterium]